MVEIHGVKFKEEEELLSHKCNTLIDESSK